MHQGDDAFEEYNSVTQRTDSQYSGCIYQIQQTTQTDSDYHELLQLTATLY